MMWFLLLLYIAHSEQVITEGPADESRRLILKDGNNPCEGYVQVYYDNIWGFVGDKYWDSNTEKVVCRSTQCGEPVKDSTSDVDIDPKKVWLNEVQCKGTENHLWDCQYPGWGISVYQKQTVKKIKCSNQIKIDLDGFKCAGAVRYSTDGKTPSGYFCADKLGEAEANHVCKSLKCGEVAEIPQKEWMVWEGFRNSKKMAIKCSDKSIDDLWHCVTQESPSCQTPVSVKCTDYERMQLRGNTTNACSGNMEIEKNNKWIVKNTSTDLNTSCQQMYCGTYVTHSQDDNGTQLTCSNKVEVGLMQDSNKCYGDVIIKVNNSDHHVCASSWTNQNAEMVCSELKCGSLMEWRKATSPGKRGIMDFVNCMGQESSLWHCKAKHHNKAFQCSSTAYVVCSNSIGVRLKDGPGKCAGRVEIWYEGQWINVRNQEWTKTNSDIVCKQLKCGNARESPSTEKFSTGSPHFLNKKVNCKPSAKNISECNITDYNNSKDEPVGIICEEHKVVFLEESSCSGKVGIQHGDNTYWLSGSKETWNQETANTVCRQVHCGTAQSFNYTLSADRNAVSKKSYSCSSNSTSLFDCENNLLPSDHNDTIATVTCSGKIHINLTNNCWGNVNICMEGKCGGVCANTWTEKKSMALCKQLGCGNKSLPPYNVTKKYDVIFKSVHMTDNLTKCNFVKNDDKSCNNSPAYVVCSGSIKPQIQNSREKCFGNVEVYYENQWLPVCKDALEDKNTQNTICKELGCGQAVKNIDYFGKSVKNRVILQLKCSANEKSLAACNVSHDTSPCSYGGLQCSDRKKIKLKDVCSGAVLLQSQGKNQTAVSVEGFSQIEGNMLCNDLGCGSFKSKMEKNSSYLLWNGIFNCKGANNPQNIWGCEKPQAPTQKKQLSIVCEGQPKVHLSDTCYGEVKLNGTEVCSSSWETTYSHMVCQELNCSNAIAGDFSHKEPDANQEYYHIKCDDQHNELGQCNRFLAKCKGKLVSVSCVGNVQFNTTETCGGQIKVKYRNKWENVCAESDDFKERLCRYLGCNRLNETTKKKEQQQTANLETTLHCTKDHVDIKHCVLQRFCEKRWPADIYCEGYVKKIPNKSPPTSSLPIILGVGFSLVLLILIIVFVRICIIKKAKNVSSRIFSRQEVEFESGDVADFTSKANEMEDRGRFRSEHDAQSTSSYDDIDEVDEARPLTYQADTAGSSGDNYIPESELDQSADGVTYEVEDPQENYDDIEASPEITQTQAEVHGSPKTTPESDAVITGLVQEDEDYLVPDQDG